MSRFSYLWSRDKDSICLCRKVIWEYPWMSKDCPRVDQRGKYQSAGILRDLSQVSEPGSWCQWVISRSCELLGVLNSQRLQSVMAWQLSPKLGNMRDSLHSETSRSLPVLIWRQSLGLEDWPYLKAVSKPGCLVYLYRYPRHSFLLETFPRLHKW